jgi:type IV secretory pathway VirB6-like protein
MLFAKKIKQILLLVFLVSMLASCDTECYEADQFYSKMQTIKANGDIEKSSTGTPRAIFGTYNHKNGGQIIEWQDTGMVANGDYFVIAISGGWVEVGGNNNDNQEKEISNMISCRLCFKNRSNAESDNCICGPILDRAELDEYGKIIWETPQVEQKQQDGLTENDVSDPTLCRLSENAGNIDLCTCKNLEIVEGGKTIDQKSIFFKDSKDEDYYSFSRAAFLKTSSLITDHKKRPGITNSCAYKMGVGLYIGLVPPGKSLSPLAYHLASTEVICPIALKKYDNKKRCIDGNGVDRTKVIYRSPGRKIFRNNDGSATGDENYHKFGDKVKLNIYDQYLSDNSGKYKVEFMRGVLTKEGDGLMADIVRKFDRYLFGANYYDEKLKIRVVKEGVVEFMYKAVLKDPIVRSIISISLVMYITFYGLAFFMGMTDFGKKEIMMRLLKIGLVILFTNEKAWLMYNDIIVRFFKNGMDSLVGTITGIFESNMDRTLASIAVESEGSSVALDAGRKFIYSDNLIMDLISKPNMSRIFGLLWIPGGRGFFALIYIPVILLLIIYFIYMVLDVALKYLINLLKICIGLALGPVFILFSLFEKTKDMFNNWLAFVASRSLEIVILFTMLHPFLIIIDHSFKDMLTFEVCSVEKDVGNGLWSFSVSKPSDGSNVNTRDLFDWFKYFLEIAALIFITKSICDKAGYISGQLISIGGVANADAVTETGRGEGGFNMATSIAKGAFGLAKTALTNSKISQAGKFAGRVMIRGLTKIGRAEIGQSGSINDMVNNAFKAVGIRNRGLRSYMRDREVDNALKFAVGDADRMGLEGKARDHHIRKTVKSRIDAFKNENKNKASLLGLDEKNIEKRLNQKLFEEPMKSQIKKQADELKQQGIYGKDARDLIKDGVQKWADKNLDISKGAIERKVSEFFKKTTVEGRLESSSEMNASEALRHVENLISSGKAKDAKNFGDKYRKHVLENEGKKSQQFEQNKRDGGIIVKGVAGGINIFSKVVVQPFGFAKKYGGKAVNKITGTETVNVDKYNDYYRESKLQSSKVYLATKAAAPINAFIKGLNYASNPRKSSEERKESYEKRKVNSESVRKFLGVFENNIVKTKDTTLGLFGNSLRNQRKELRKFDRGLTEVILKSENLEKIFKSENSQEGRGKAFDLELSRIVDKDGRSAFNREFVNDDGIMTETKYKSPIEDRTLWRAKESDGLLNSGLKIVTKILLSPIYIPANFIKKNAQFYFRGDAKTLQGLRREARLDSLRSLVTKNRDAIEALNKNDKEAQLNNIRKDKDLKESLALMMKKMEKSAKSKQENKAPSFSFGEEKNNKNKIDIEELKGKDSAFERISMFEKARGSESKDLKSAYMEAVNKKIDEYSRNPTKNLEKLKELKGALFADMDKIGKNEDLKNIFNREVVSREFDVTGTSGASPAGAPDANASNVISDLDSVKKVSNLEKQKELLKMVYEGEEIIAKTEAQYRNDNLPPAPAASDQAPDAPASAPDAPTSPPAAPAPAAPAQYTPDPAAPAVPSAPTPAGNQEAEKAAAEAKVTAEKAADTRAGVEKEAADTKVAADAKSAEALAKATAEKAAAEKAAAEKAAAEKAAADAKVFELGVVTNLILGEYIDVDRNEIIRIINGESARNPDMSPKELAKEVRAQLDLLQSKK